MGQQYDIRQNIDLSKGHCISYFLKIEMFLDRIPRFFSLLWYMNLSNDTENLSNFTSARIMA